MQKLILSLLAFCGVMQAGVIAFYFDAPALHVAPGSHAIFMVTVSNPTADRVYLNADSLTLLGDWGAAGLTVDDQFITNAPLFLEPFGSPGDSSNFLLLDVSASLTAMPGAYSGQMELQGGADSSEASVLAGQPFSVTVVVPEPGTGAVIPFTLAALALGRLRRRG